MQITIGTFNTYNLFTRYKFRGRRKRFPAPAGSGKKYIYKWVKYSVQELYDAVKDGFSFHSHAFLRLSQEDRELTAAVVEALDADILAVQEVESLDTLKLFNSQQLRSSRKFRYKYMISGNDMRGIDIGLLSKYPTRSLVTHQYIRNAANTAYLFSRDCLELELEVDGRPLHVFVNHLKSMFGGRAETRPRRAEQAQGIIDILTERFGPNFGDADFVVLGDLNDYVEPGEEDKSGITALTQSTEMEDVVARLPKEQRWTYYYHKERAYNQLDYLFLSRSLAARNTGVLPTIERRGMPQIVNHQQSPPKVPEFFSGVSGTTKASDHAGVSITIDF